MLFLFLQEHIVFSWLFIVLLGLVLGSFVNAVVYRLPKQLMVAWRDEARSFLHLGDVVENVATTPPQGVNWSLLTRSFCPHCYHPISWWQNFPVLSYIGLRGRCFFCAKRISLRYPLVEIFSVFLTAWPFCVFGPTLRFVLAVIFGFYLLAAALIDFDTQLLPDELTWPILMLGFFVNSFSVFVPLRDAVWGALAGYYCLWLVYWVFFWITKKHGFGFGDFKLMGALGSWLGWQSLPFVVFGSCALALLVSLFCFFRSCKPGCSHTESDFLHWQIPFGPYLALMGWVALFFVGDSFPHGLRFLWT